MRLCHVLTLFLVLCDGRPGLSRAEAPVYTATEGRDFTAKFVFYESENWKFFCKNDCNKTEDILAETTSYRKQNGRYSIRYEKQPSNLYVLSVSITDVSSSDSGTYSCGLRTQRGSITKSEEFIINVTKAASSSDPAVAPRPPVSSLSYNGTTTSRPSEHQQQLTTSPSDVLLPVVLKAVGIFISLTLFILYWRKRDNKPREPPEATAQIPERDHEYEEIPDRNRAGPVEMCPASVSFSNTTETSTVYSLLSAPCGQTQTEDCSSKVTYSGVVFAKSSSAPQSQTEAAAGAVQTEAVTVYSTVAVPQQ